MPNPLSSSVEIFQKDESVSVSAEAIRLPGHLTIPVEASGIVIFAHGSGSSRLSPRNLEVAFTLNHDGLATLLFDLLTETESRDRDLVFDIDFLARRLVAATEWVMKEPDCMHLPLGYFGASTGAAAALVASVDIGKQVSAVVSRGGRPDLAMPVLDQVTAPTLLIVGSRDIEVLELNRIAQRQLRCENELEVVPDATHLFEEPGALAAVSRLASSWFRSNFGTPRV